MVLGFFLMVWASLAVIRAAAPDVYDQALRLPPSWPRWAGTVFLLALAALIALLVVGVLRRWRWAFWLILLAFLAGVLRVPVAILQLTHVLSTNVPSWYVVFQGLIGLAQLAIGLAMLVGYRRSGVWGAVGAALHELGQSSTAGPSRHRYEWPSSTEPENWAARGSSVKHLSDGLLGTSYPVRGRRRGRPGAATPRSTTVNHGAPRTTKPTAWQPYSAVMGLQVRIWHARGQIQESAERVRRARRADGIRTRMRFVARYSMAWARGPRRWRLRSGVSGSGRRLRCDATRRR